MFAVACIKEWAVHQTNEARPVSQRLPGKRSPLQMCYETERKDLRLGSQDLHYSVLHHKIVANDLGAIAFNYDPCIISEWRGSRRARTELLG
jgi:hypothetical protein